MSRQNVNSENILNCKFHKYKSQKKYKPCQ